MNQNSGGNKAAPKVILIVEDDPIGRKMVRTALRAEGYVVDEAEDGREALDRMEKRVPDLILQDIQLPDIDGFELVERLRSLPGGADLPIVALTGYRTQFDPSPIRTGFTDYLFKPVAPSTLLQVIRTHLEPVSKKLPGRRIFLVDDDPLSLKLLHKILLQAGFEVTTSLDGEEALEKMLLSPPDAVISDVLMPRLDGFQLCEKLRRHPLLGQAPVILVSAAYSEEADRELALKAGANALVIRTPDYKETLRALNDALLKGANHKPGAGLPPEEYINRLTSQIDRQTRLNQSLFQRLALREVEIAILSGATKTLTEDLPLAAVLQKLLNHCLNAAGFSRGAIYLRGDGGRFFLQAEGGYPEGSRTAGLLGWSKLLEKVADREDPIMVPGPQLSAEEGKALIEKAGVGSMIICAIRATPSGLLWFASDEKEMNKDWVPFARAIAFQVSQAIILSQAFSRVKEAEGRYRTLFENTFEGLFRLDPEGRIVLANRALAHILGYGSGPELISSAPSFSKEFGSSKEVEALAFRMRREAVEGFEFQSLNKKGQCAWFSLSARPRFDPAGALLYVEGSAREITERKRTEELAQLDAVPKKQL